jgi:hypothetical protein
LKQTKGGKDEIINDRHFVFKYFDFCVRQSGSRRGNAIPYPLKEWKGVQGKTLAESKPDFIGQPKAPEGAPNVLIIMLDDAGYSSATSFGGS